MAVDGMSLPGDEGVFAERSLGELAEGVGWWLSSRTSSPGTWASYCADLGVPYLLAAHEQGGVIANEVRKRFGVRLPVHEPDPRNTTWHTAFLPWLARNGITDPWGGDVCRVVGEWGRELAGLGHWGDHVWSTDAERVTPLSSAFIRRRAASVQSYYRWHYGMGWCECSPADIWTPKAAGVPAAPAFRDAVDELDRDDLARLQLAADQHDGTAGDRELSSAVVAVLVATACRAVEVSRFEVGDYVRSARRGPLLRLHTKARDERWIELDEATAERIDRWVRWRPDLAEFGGSAEGRLSMARRMPHRVPLFTTLSGPRGVLAWARREQEGHPGRLRERSVWHLLRRVCSRASSPLVNELGEWIYPHAIRAAVATDLLDEGVPINEVQRLLGHASPTMTARYDRRARERHLPAAATAAWRQSTALEHARKLALTSGN